MGIVHQQRYQRDHTIDAQPSDPIAVRRQFVLARAISRIEERLDKIEAALRDAVTHNASTVTPVTPDRNAVTEDVTPRNAYRNAERQRRYRERKKQHGAADSER